MVFLCCCYSVSAVASNGVFWFLLCLFVCFKPIWPLEWMESTQWQGTVSLPPPSQAKPEWPHSCGTPSYKYQRAWICSSSPPELSCFLGQLSDSTAQGCGQDLWETEANNLTSWPFPKDVFGRLLMPIMNSLFLWVVPTALKKAVSTTWPLFKMSTLDSQALNDYGSVS